MVQVSGGTARKPAAQPHERPAVAQTDAGERVKSDRQNVTAAKQPVHAENRRPDAVNRPAAVQAKNAAQAQGKQNTVRPAVKTAAPKEPEVKNQVSKPTDKRAVQHKQSETMRNKPDGTGHTGKAGGKQNGGGGR